MQSLLLVKACFNEYIAVFLKFCPIYTISIMVNSPVLAELYNFSNANEPSSQTRQHKTQKADDESNW